MGTIFGLPAILIAIGTIIGGVIAGVLYLIGVYGKSRSTNTRDAEKANQYVIKSLQQQITELEKKIAEATDSLVETNRRLDDLQKENKSLRDVLQGRDADTQKFQQQGFEIMNEAVPQMMTLQKKTNDNVEKLYKAIEKHLAQMEKTQTVTVTTGVPTKVE